jgi:hypothetical protein
MPQSRPTSSPILPVPVRPDEARFIRETVKRFYGENAIVRSYGPDPKRLLLHVETDIEPGMEQHDCLGVLMCEINRDQISLSATKRGRRIFGGAKLAYRQGEILS